MIGFGGMGRSVHVGDSRTAELAEEWFKMMAELYDKLLTRKNQGEVLNFDAISNIELAELTEVESISHDDVAKLFDVSKTVVDNKHAAYGLTEDQRFGTFINLVWQFQIMSNLYFAELDAGQQKVLHTLEVELNDYIRRHGFVPSLENVLGELPYTRSLLKLYQR